MTIQPCEAREHDAVAAAPQLLGRGRSGVVYLTQQDGAPCAYKVFGDAGLTKLVQCLFLGAPNPYRWNPHAIRCAELRRRLLTPLVGFWFGGKLRVANASGHRFDATHSAYALSTEYCAGRAPRLRHPLRPVDDETTELRDEIMRPLQQRLMRAGLDGLVWQAGLGNPVALNNFLRETTPEGGHRWCWIDLESGVPALFALDPTQLLGFYLPRSIRHRRPLFDDVDIPRLRAYLAGEAGLRDHLGSGGFEQLCQQVDALELEQRLWKQQPRAERSVDYHLVRGTIDICQAAYFRAHPFRWYLRCLRRALGKLPRFAVAAMATLVSLIAARGLATVQAAWRFVMSPRYRSVIARRQVERRIEAWRERGQLSKSDTAVLKQSTAERGTSTYLSDFGMHLAIKPAVKLIQLVVCPALLVAGVIDEVSLAAVVLFGGVVARTSYTVARMGEATLRGKERPWTALWVGLLPMVGNFAFPVQIVRSALDGEQLAARFLLTDAVTHVGGHLPIWGGADTLTEHVFNRLSSCLLGQPTLEVATPILTEGNPS